MPSSTTVRTIHEHLHAESNHIQGVVTSVLHEKGRKIWEVYAGKGRTAEVETCSRETGWDFDIASHSLWFLQRLESECPDEVLLTPTCGPWSPMQNLNARDPEQQAQLLEKREWHHGTRLAFDPNQEWWTRPC